MEQQKQNCINNISNKTTATKTSAARANHRYQYRWNTIVDAIAKGKRATEVRPPFKMMIIAVATHAESLVAVIVGIVARDRRDEEEDSPTTVTTTTTTTAVTFVPAIMRIRVVLDVVGLHQEIIMRRLELVREEQEEKEIIGHHRTIMWIPLDVALEVDPQRELHHHTGAVVVAVDRATTTITIDAKANANANALPVLLAMEN